MKHLLLTTIAAVLLVGCGNPEADRALVKAAIDGNIEAAKQAIADGADVDAKGKVGSTALLWAITFSNTEVAELLIAKDADVNARGRLFGITPLHAAASEDLKEIAELLISKNVNVNAKLKDGTTSLDMAIGDKHPEIIDLLRKHAGKTAEELKAEGK